ncbi:MAG: hypothetical protein FWE32_00810 [Oscillospiraceae bacterium]|nr:hypothetical protein [Oscillospiraceae bacterium]
MKVFLFVILAGLVVKMFIYADYAIVGIVTFFLLSERAGIHTAIALLITIAALGVVFFLNQLTVKNIYVFKILGSLFSGWVVGAMLGSGFTDEAGNPDRIWIAVITIIATGVILLIRARYTGLVRRQKVLPEEEYSM